mgnify:CR=1 FL=1
MEQQSIKLNKKTGKPIKNHGGVRKGAGRPLNSKQQLTVSGLLEELKEKSGGQNYESMLVEDFLRARNVSDQQLTLKYHNLILNKVMSSLAKIEVTDSKDAIEAKQAAFAEALAKLVGVSPDAK